jgi:hypothetical protein
LLKWDPRPVPGLCSSQLLIKDLIKITEIQQDNVPLNTPYGNAICWNIVQDNYFFPDVPRNLAKKRPNKPVIIGNSKDEWAVWGRIF